jgi:hypothetical protein
MDELTPFVFNVKDNKVVMKNEEGAIKLVTGFFDKTSPSLDEYRHVAWTDETYAEVAEQLKAAIPYPDVIKMLIAETRDEKMKQLLSDSSSLKDTAVSSNGISDIDNVPFAGTTVNHEVKETTTEVADADSDDEYDDLFKDL